MAKYEIKHKVATEEPDETRVQNVVSGNGYLVLLELNATDRCFAGQKLGHWKIFMKCWLNQE
jgi:hypothetical protein